MEAASEEEDEEEEAEEVEEAEDVGAEPEAERDSPSISLGSS